MTSLCAFRNAVILLSVTIFVNVTAYSTPKVPSIKEIENVFNELCSATDISLVGVCDEAAELFEIRAKNACQSSYTDMCDKIRDIHDDLDEYNILLGPNGKCEREIERRTCSSSNIYEKKLTAAAQCNFRLKRIFSQFESRKKAIEVSCKPEANFATAASESLCNMLVHDMCIPGFPANKAADVCEDTFRQSVCGIATNEEPAGWATLLGYLIKSNPIFG